jgi:hypothetical protein
MNSSQSTLIHFDLVGFAPRPPARNSFKSTLIRFDSLGFSRIQTPFRSPVGPRCAMDVSQSLGCHHGANDPATARQSLGSALRSHQFGLIYPDLLGFTLSDPLPFPLFRKCRSAIRFSQPEVQLSNSAGIGLIHFDSVGFRQAPIPDFLLSSFNEEHRKAWPFRTFPVSGLPFPVCHHGADDFSQSLESITVL